MVQVVFVQGKDAAPEGMKEGLTNLSYAKEAPSALMTDTGVAQTCTERQAGRS